MDEELCEDLNALLEKQASLQSELRKLGARNSLLEEEISKLCKLVWEARGREARKPLPEAKKSPALTPPPLPADFDQPPANPTAASAASAATAVAQATQEERKKQDDISALAPAMTPPAEKPKLAKGSNIGEWELNFGRVWLVRIGVLLLLTGLIFLSTYAYKNWLFHAGAGAKVAFFITVSLVLTGAGLWLEKRREGFRQYGRVLASGGLAAGYYTIYAAHFVPSLKLVDSPVVAGVLLTLWAGVILGYAVWKQSRVVAVMAIGLAFYGTVVNPSGWLSLFSALLLSSSGIWLMLRFRWVSIGLGVVAAAYTSHAFWLGFYPGEAAEPVRLTYLACYWLLFTSALMVPQARQLPVSVQRWMAALNNAAAWCLTVFSIPWLMPHQEIGWISLGIGVVWIGIAAVARTGKLWHKSLAMILGYQGLMIVSLGLLIEATGYTRFLVLAVEACVILLGAKHFGGWLARVASTLVFFAALVTALPEMNGHELASWPSYAALAAVCAAYTGIVKRDGAESSLVAIVPACITWLVLGAGVFHQWQTPAAVNGIWIATVAVILVHALIKESRWQAGLQELAITSVPVALVAGWWFLTEFENMALWQSILPLLGAWVIWWRCPKLLESWEELTRIKEEKPSTALEWMFGVLFWLMVGAASGHHMQDESTWMILGGLLAIAGHGMAEYFKRRSIGGPALVFHVLALIFLIRFGNAHPLAGWAPALLLAVHLVLVARGWKLFSGGTLLGLLAFGLTAAVATHAVQEFDRPDLTLTAFGLVMAAWAFRRREIAVMMPGAVFPILLGALIAVMKHSVDDWGRYLPVFAALGLHGMLWRETKQDDNWKPCRIVLLLAGLITLIIASSTHVLEAFDGAGLAICWALLASLLFCTGLAIRCRPYRLIGMWWLAAAVLHVVCIDVMQLEALGRILSFITLGLVLLVLGFLYNKFQDTIRKFL